MTPSPLPPVFCVYGAGHARHIREVFLPALARSATAPVALYLLNYDGTAARAVSGQTLGPVTVREIANPTGRVTGFAESNNLLFDAVAPAHSFVLVNPDCIPQPGALDALVARHRAAAGGAGIVEGRQWPFEHPKEYDRRSGETPWASGAFCLVDAAFYRAVGGMDPRYFLYLEDVDLSWRAWLAGYSVLYAPEAAIAHFTDSPLRRADLVGREAAYSARNFLLIAKKFFGASGLRRAIERLQAADPALAAQAQTAFVETLDARVGHEHDGRRSRMIKILGVCQFHETRA